MALPLFPAQSAAALLEALPANLVSIRKNRKPCKWLKPVCSYFFHIQLIFSHTLDSQIMLDEKNPKIQWFIISKNVQRQLELKWWPYTIGLDVLHLHQLLLRQWEVSRALQQQVTRVAQNWVLWNQYSCQLAVMENSTLPKHSQMILLTEIQISSWINTTKESSYFLQRTKLESPRMEKAPSITQSNRPAITSLSHWTSVPHPHLPSASPRWCLPDPWAAHRSIRPLFQRRNFSWHPTCPSWFVHTSSSFSLFLLALFSPHNHKCIFWWLLTKQKYTPNRIQTPLAPFGLSQQGNLPVAWSLCRETKQRWRATYSMPTWKMRHKDFSRLRAVWIRTSLFVNVCIVPCIAFLIHNLHQTSAQLPGLHYNWQGLSVLASLLPNSIITFKEQQPQVFIPLLLGATYVNLSSTKHSKECFPTNIHSKDDNLLAVLYPVHKMLVFSSQNPWNCWLLPQLRHLTKSLGGTTVRLCHCYTPCFVLRLQGKLTFILDPKSTLWMQPWNCLTATPESDLPGKTRVATQTFPYHSATIDTHNTNCVKSQPAQPSLCPKFPKQHAQQHQVVKLEKQLSGCVALHILRSPATRLAGIVKLWLYLCVMRSNHEVKIFPIWPSLKEKQKSFNFSSSLKTVTVHQIVYLMSYTAGYWSKKHEV